MDAHKVMQCIPSMAGGGAERQFVYLTRGLIRRGWDVSVVVTHEGPNFHHLLSSGARIYRPAAWTNYDPSLFIRISHIIKKEQPSLVQTWLLQMDVFGGLAALKQGVPWILSERSSALCYTKSVKYKLREMLAVRASAIVANSCDGREYWRSRVGAHALSRIIPNGVPLSQIEEATALPSLQSGIADDAEVILFVGRWSPEKNWENLLPALREVLRVPDRVVVLCGQGLQSAEVIQKLVAEQGSHRVRVLGYVNEIWAWMKRASVFVSVGFFEGKPNGVLEAMACGCSLVVSDIPAHREFLDESSAVLVNPCDVLSITKGIELCLTDPSSARSRSERARGIIAQWSVERMVGRYEELYREVTTRWRELRGEKLRTHRGAEGC